MKVAYVITRADAVGGASIHVRDLARGMAALGHEVLVLVGGQGPFLDELVTAGIPFSSMRYLRRNIQPVADARAVGELSQALRKFRPTLVSVHTAKAGWIGRAACARLGLPVVYTPHGWSIADRVSRTGGFVFAAAERLAGRWSEAIVCVCDHERQLAVKKRIAPRERLHVIYNGVHDVAAGLRAIAGAEPVRIVSVARFEAPKDPATLLRALASFRRPSWRLEFVGDGPLEQDMKALAGRLGVADWVHFTGYCADPAPVLARGQIFALCSRSEAFPRSVLEAMRAGLPVVASNVGGVGEAVLDGVTGRLVSSADPEAWAVTLREVINNALARQRWGRAGRHTYETRFRFGRMLDETQQLYATIVENNTA